MRSRYKILLWSSLLTIIISFSSTSYGKVKKAVDDDLGGDIVQLSQNENTKFKRFLENRPFAYNLEVREFDSKKIKLHKNKLKIKLPSGKNAQFTKTSLTAAPGGGLFWRGIDNSNGRIDLIIGEGSIHAIINHENKIYHITQIDDKYHGVFELPKDELPNDDDETGLRDECEEPDCSVFNWPGSTQGSSNGIANIRVLAVYTRDVLDFFGSASSARNRAVLLASQTNDAFYNNGINGQVSIDLVHVDLVDYYEVGDHTSIREAVKSNADLVSMREYYGADVVAIMVKDITSCGRANAIGASPDTAFFTINLQCASYTFPHELGHLMGAFHNPEEWPYGTFNHGYLDTNNGFRTIMSYNKDGCCDRINYFSTPDQYYQGAVIGTAADHDNKRVVKNAAIGVANFKLKTTPVVDTPSMSNYSFACYGENDVYWTQEYSETTISYKLYRSNYSNMASKVLHYSGPATNAYINLNSPNDRPYFAVEACDANGCAELSSSVKTNYTSGCL